MFVTCRMHGSVLLLYLANLQSQVLVPMQPILRKKRCELWKSASPFVLAYLLRLLRCSCGEPTSFSKRLQACPTAFPKNVEQFRRPHTSWTFNGWTFLHSPPNDVSKTSSKLSPLLRPHPLVPGQLGFVVTDAFHWRSLALTGGKITIDQQKPFKNTY